MMLLFSIRRGPGSEGNKVLERAERLLYRFFSIPYEVNTPFDVTRVVDIEQAESLALC